MSFGKARMHVKTTVPPGTSLVGVLPHTLFRLERAKLHENPHLKLVNCDGQYVPFDGKGHDLRGSCGTTLTLGNFVALHVQNDSPDPQPFEVQIAGTCADADWLPAHEPGQPAPELTHNVVLGLMAQEVTVERYAPATLPDAELLASAQNHYNAALRQVAIAFEQACITGTTEAFFQMRSLEDHADRCFRLIKTLQYRIDNATQPAPVDDLGDFTVLPSLEPSCMSPEDYQALLVRAAERSGKTVEEVRAEVARLATQRATPAGGALPRGFNPFSDE